jgi:hypothetical protein
MGQELMSSFFIFPLPLGAGLRIIKPYNPYNTRAVLHRGVVFCHSRLSGSAILTGMF